MSDPVESRSLADDFGAISFVQGSPLCGSLPEEQLNRLIDAGHVEKFPVGSVVFEQGDTQDSFYLIIDGSVTVSKTAGETTHELATLERPAVFGEIAVLMQRPRSARVMAKTDVRLVCFPGDVVRAVAEVEPQFGRKLAALMAARTKKTEQLLAK